METDTCIYTHTYTHMTVLVWGCQERPELKIVSVRKFVSVCSIMIWMECLRLCWTPNVQWHQGHWNSLETHMDRVQKFVGMTARRGSNARWWIVSAVGVLCTTRTSANSSRKVVETSADQVMDERVRNELGDAGTMGQRWRGWRRDKSSRTVGTIIRTSL